MIIQSEKVLEKPFERRIDVEKLTVLVVDDQENVARCVACSVQDTLVEKNLNGVEIEILFACGPYKGLQYFSSKVIDVLITDLEMPMLDGEALLRVVANFSPNTFLVLMTGNEDYQLPNDLRSISKLEKPIDDEDLEIVMSEALAYIFETTERQEI
jgi:DNA-binding NtrC family response regulator